MSTSPTPTCEAHNFGKYVINICGALANCPIQIGTGITPAQLYTTASYHAYDLSGIDFSYNNLDDGSFAGQNLTNANFSGATLTDLNFSGAEIRGANFDTHYRGVVFNGEVFGTGITLDQLYSTASYLAQDLSGIGLSGNFNLDGTTSPDRTLPMPNLRTLTGVTSTLREPTPEAPTSLTTAVATLPQQAHSTLTLFKRMDRSMDSI